MPRREGEEQTTNGKTEAVKTVSARASLVSDRGKLTGQQMRGPGERGTAVPALGDNGSWRRKET